jgi:hypothetical protein
MKRLWIFAGALVVTLAALGLALLLGSATFDYRRYSQHEGRLGRVMREQPTAARLTQGLRDEGTVLLVTATTREEKERAIVAHGGKKAVELRAKAARHPQMRVFRAADMLYFVFFDGEGVMRDFTCVSG